MAAVLAQGLLFMQFSQIYGFGGRFMIINYIALRNADVSQINLYLPARITTLPGTRARLPGKLTDLLCILLILHHVVHAPELLRLGEGPAIGMDVLLIYIPGRGRVFLHPLWT